MCRIIKTTTFYALDVFQLIEQAAESSSDVAVKIFGNIGNHLVQHKHTAAGDSVITIEQDEKKRIDIRIFDPAGKQNQGFAIDGLKDPEFFLSSPKFMSVIADRSTAVGRLHFKRAHTKVKDFLVRCDACGKGMNLHEEAYAFRYVFPDRDDMHNPYGKMFFHTVFPCVKRQLYIPSTTSTAHTFPIGWLERKELDTTLS